MGTTTVLLPQVVDSARKASFSYSTSVEQADVTAAYTRKPDGRRIEVPPGNDQVQVQVQSGQGDGAAAFSDQTTTTVIFPEVSEARVRVDMPAAGMAMQPRAIGMQEELGGLAAAYMREAFRHRTREQKSDLLRQHFQSMQLEGSGHITHDDPQPPPAQRSLSDDVRGAARLRPARPGRFGHRPAAAQLQASGAPRGVRRAGRGGHAAHPVYRWPLGRGLHHRAEPVPQRAAGSGRKALRDLRAQLMYKHKPAKR